MKKYKFYIDFDSPSTFMKDYSLFRGITDRINFKLTKFKVKYSASFTVFNNDSPSAIPPKVDDTYLIDY